MERGLTELDEKTLLFLNNINTITYELPDGTVGIIEREAIDERVIQIQKSEGDDFVESHWLRLVGPSSVHGQGPTPLSVAAAFRLVAQQSPQRSPRSATEGGEGLETKWSVEPLQNGDVCIYFPAVKESSGLRFHVHAPFASTVARDSIRDDTGNVQLVADLALLIAGALPALCAEGLISDSLLAALPNEDDQIVHPYTLIRDAVYEAFNSQSITPVWGSTGGYAPARSLVSSPSEFRNWLDPSDLLELFRLVEIETDQFPRWIRDRDGRAGKFLSGLETVEFGWDQLSHALTNARDVGDPDDPYLPGFKEWLERKSDRRLVDFYQLIGRGILTREVRSSSLKTVPLIRLRQRGRVKHVVGADTYLPSTRRDTVQSRVPVDMAFFEGDEDSARANNLRAFYGAAGARRWNESAKIEQRLSAYEHGKTPVPGDDDDFARHLDDVRSFVRFGLANRSTAADTFGDVPFILATQSDGSARWVTPRQTFIDVPFRDTGLSALYPRVKMYWKLSGEYAYDQAPHVLAGYYVEIEGIEEFLETTGGIVDLRIAGAEVTDNPHFSWAWRYANRENGYGEQIDWHIERLDKLLSAENESLLHLLWHTVVRAPANRAVASYRANGSSKTYQMESQLAQTLQALPWIRHRNGGLRLPSEMTDEDLPDGWERPSSGSLVHKLAYGAKAARRRQQEQGVTEYLRDEGLEEDGMDLLREAKEVGLTNADLREMVREKAAMMRFPQAPSQDPDRRLTVAEQDATDAPEYVASLRERSVVDGRAAASVESRAYLRGQYTTANGEMFCQGCRRPLPFKMKDGAWYFEAVRYVPARKNVHIANAVALCPLCAALYKYARDTPNQALVSQIAGIRVAAGQGIVDVPVILDAKRVLIRFTAKHAIDLQGALRAAGESRSVEG